MRQDKFQENDLVEFIEPDLFTNGYMKEHTFIKYGPGPYVVKQVQEIFDPKRKYSQVDVVHAKHTQWLLIGRDLYSGVWFNPIR